MIQKTQNIHQFLWKGCKIIALTWSSARLCTQPSYLAAESFFIQCKETAEYLRMLFSCTCGIKITLLPLSQVYSHNGVGNHSFAHPLTSHSALFKYLPRRYPLVNFHVSLTYRPQPPSLQQGVDRVTTRCPRRSHLRRTRGTSWRADVLYQPAPS